jgi:hypothetical protein
MLGTSRLLAAGVFLVGILLGASVCNAGRPASAPGQGAVESPRAAAYGPTSATLSTDPLVASITARVPFSRGDSMSCPAAACAWAAGLTRPWLDT